MQLTCRPTLTTKPGYRIRISADAAQSLQRLLPPRLYSAFEATCAELRDDGHQFDAISGKVTRWAAGPPKSATSQSKAYNADRAILRNLLLSGMGEHVEFGKRFQGYHATPRGGLDLTFADHATEHTDMLVGADGVRSNVRQQRIPGLRLLDTEGRAIFGKTPITPGFFDRVPQELSQGLSLIGESSDSKMKLFCDPMVFNRTDGTESAESLGLRLPADYLYWVLVFRRDTVRDPDFDKVFYQSTPSQSAQRSHELTAHWQPRIRSIFTEQDPSAASSLTFLAANSDSLGNQALSSPAPDKRDAIVTLLGDSAHPMPPVGGFGANAAFNDAAALCDALCYGNTNVAAHIKSYEQEMYARAQSVVQRSIDGSGRFFGMRPTDELQYAKPS